MDVVIDNKSGFCAGVTAAISAAEKELKRNSNLYCLGDLVHNSVEMKRLTDMGLIVISYEEMKKLRNKKILIRAHGEPPTTYQIAKDNNLEILDYTCPVVLRLQENIKKAFIDINKKGGNVVIYGKPGHAEVIGLNGQTNNNAIVVNSPTDIVKVDCSKPISLFSQTTKDEDGFYDTAEIIRKKMIHFGLDPNKNMIIHNSICKLVSHRIPQLKEFAIANDVIIFVSGIQSSNGKYLYSICKNVNKNSFFISTINEIDNINFGIAKKVGICGATSTPMWLMEDIAKKIKKLNILK